MRNGKRRPQLPPEAAGILEAVSKADLLEAAWWLAGSCGESADDGAETRKRLIQELNILRANRGARCLLIPEAPP
jgi:hypothetical protein